MVYGVILTHLPSIRESPTSMKREEFNTSKELFSSSFIFVTCRF